MCTYWVVAALAVLLWLRRGVTAVWLRNAAEGGGSPAARPGSRPQPSTAAACSPTAETNPRNIHVLRNLARTRPVCLSGEAVS